MIALGSDHGGYELKRHIMTYLESKCIPSPDYGTYTTASCNYPEYARAAAQAVASGACEGSKPRPSSTMSRRTESSAPVRVTTTRPARACCRTLARAPWATRSRATSTVVGNSHALMPADRGQAPC